jgi:hypothetical protein
MDASKKARLITLAATRRYHHLVADRPATTPNTVEQSNTIRAAIQTYGTHFAGITRDPKEIAVHEHTSPTQLKIPAVGADLPLCIATSLLQNIVPEVVPHVRSASYSLSCMSPQVRGPSKSSAKSNASPLMLKCRESLPSTFWRYSVWPKWNLSWWL